MYERLRNHVEGLFADAPQTLQMVEIREEILQNTIDRYTDLIAEGNHAETAFQMAVAGIGDVRPLINSLMAPQAASGYTGEELQKNRRLQSLLLSIAIMLYICSVLPPLIFEALGRYEVIGIVLMFLMIAAATGLIIYRHGIALPYNRNEDASVGDCRKLSRPDKEDTALLRAISCAVWCVTLIVYCILSISTGAWYITWLTFPIGWAVTNIIKAVFDLVKSK